MTTWTKLILFLFQIFYSADKMMEMTEIRSKLVQVVLYLMNSETHPPADCDLVHSAGWPQSELLAAFHLHGLMDIIAISI